MIMPQVEWIVLLLAALLSLQSGYKHLASETLVAHLHVSHRGASFQSQAIGRRVSAMIGTTGLVRRKRRAYSSALTTEAVSGNAKPPPSTNLSVTAPAQLRPGSIPIPTRRNSTLKLHAGSHLPRLR